MREIIIGEETIQIRATPLALLFYRQEFKSDLVGDLTKMEAIKTDYSKLDSVALLQLIWAMAKADKYPAKFEGFIGWLASLTEFNLSDASLFSAALEEAADGFFRKGKKGPAKK